MAEALGIYLHVPFCTRRCDYCDFFVVLAADGARIPPYFESLRKDLEQESIRSGLSGTVVDSIYLGGGTPSLARPEAIASVLEDCRRQFLLSPDAETTLEANPETLRPGVIGDWLHAGINRLSLGVQSLSDDVLAPRGRLYDSGEALAVAVAARREGMPTIGVDLIAGLPHETRESFAMGLERLLKEADPDHISIYLLETGESLKETPLADSVKAGRTRLPADEEVVGMYRDALGTLTRGGYEQYEISNFCRPGRRSRHNLKYWRSTPYAGIGPSAHSYLNGRREGRPADLSAWAAWVNSVEGETGRLLDYTLEDPEAAAREALVLELRLIEGVDTARFAGRWGMNPLELLGEEIADLDEKGLVRVDGTRLNLTEDGLLMSNEVFARLA